MKIGYPCINTSIGCKSSSKFKLASFTESRFAQSAINNIDCLYRILRFNVNYGLLFFRVSSEIIPFASHPACKIDWRSRFHDRLREIGDYIKTHDIRISMHPGQFVILNSPDNNIVKQSIEELRYHCDLLDAMGLDTSAKVQIHIGGAYGDTPRAIDRFVASYLALPSPIRSRLAIENDDRLFSLSDCMEIHKRTGIPIILDSFHHECLNNNESITDALKLTSSTWSNGDGLPMVDYSSQHAGARAGTHAHHIDIDSFKGFIEKTKGINFDLMLEIKDKEKSAIEAIGILNKLG